MNRYEDVLCYVQGEPGEDLGVRRASQLVAKSAARLHLFGVIGDERTRTVQDVDDALWQRGRERWHQLEDHANALRAQGLVVDVSVGWGQPSEVITRKVITDGHDLVFKMANPEDGVTRWRFFGDTAVGLMRLCPCPVWVVRSVEACASPRVLAAIDPSDVPERRALNDAVMHFAMDLARGQEGEVHVVHAWQAIGMEAVLVPSDALRDYTDKTRRAVAALVRGYLRRFQAGVVPLDRIHLPAGAPESRIPEIATQIGADVVVMGTFARTGLGGYFLGNTAERVLSVLDASVVTIKHDQFHSSLADQAQSGPRMNLITRDSFERDERPSRSG